MSYLLRAVDVFFWPFFLVALTFFLVILDSGYINELVCIQLTVLGFSGSLSRQSMTDRSLR